MAGEVFANVWWRCDAGGGETQSSTVTRRSQPSLTAVSASVNILHKMFFIPAGAEGFSSVSKVLLYRVNPQDGSGVGNTAQLQLLRHLLVLVMAVNTSVMFVDWCLLLICNCLLGRSFSSEGVWRMDWWILFDIDTVSTRSAQFQSGRDLGSIIVSFSEACFSST